MERIPLLTSISREAGSCLAGFFGGDFAVRNKAELDLVTQADEDAEHLIVSAIIRHFPDDEILAEEGGSKPGNSGWQWIIDPLDGTTNFAHGFPQFAVSVALAHNGETIAGVVFDPIKSEFFFARKDGGAQLNNTPISTSSKKGLGEALAATGFSYDRRTRMKDLLGRAERMLWNCRGLRRLGSAALDLAYVACGRFDIFVEDGLNPWDTAAGSLLVVEAGGVVVDFSGTGLDLTSGQIVATNPDLLPLVMDKLI